MTLPPFGTFPKIHSVLVAACIPMMVMRWVTTNAQTVFCSAMPVWAFVVQAYVGEYRGAAWTRIPGASDSGRRPVHCSTGPQPVTITPLSASSQPLSASLSSYLLQGPLLRGSSQQLSSANFQIFWKYLQISFNSYLFSPTSLQTQFNFSFKHSRRDA